MLERGKGVAVWRQIERQIADDIAQGVFAEGGQPAAGGGNGRAESFGSVSPFVTIRLWQIIEQEQTTRDTAVKVNQK